MAQKAKLKTEEWLRKCLAVDITPRVIKNTDRVEMRCFGCEKTGNVRVGAAVDTLKNKGFAWRCKECGNKEIAEKAKLRTGELNHFYGKKHKKETIDGLSHKTAERVSKLGQEKRKEISVKARSAAYEKYNGNPMKNKEIAQKQLESCNTDSFKEVLRLAGLNRSKTENFSKKQAEYSTQYWSKDRDEKTSNQREVFFEHMQNEEWRKRRKDGHEAYLADPERVKKTWEKVRLACLEKYGTECCQLSVAELEILEWIKSLGLDCKKHRQGGKEIDIYIPELKIGIEYNGLYFHSELYKKRSYHLNKTRFFEKNSIRVIHIFSHEWSNRKEQVKSFIRSAIGKNDHIVGARELVFKEVPKKEAWNLLESTHIQGPPNSAILCVGGYIGEKLIVLATFGRHHRKHKKIVLSRFVTASGYTVRGALSKLTKIGIEKFGELVSWCDLRWSNGNGYEKSGWKKEEVLAPDYFYTDCKKVVSKQSRKKKTMNTPESVTEHEHALLDGLVRVYDCGKIRYSIGGG